MLEVWLADHGSSGVIFWVLLFCLLLVACHLSWHLGWRAGFREHKASAEKAKRKLL